jgi:uncharacterized protein YjbI with pentapeptide repeats
MNSIEYEPRDAGCAEWEATCATDTTTTNHTDDTTTTNHASGMVLSGMVLSGMVLSGMVLSGMVLSGMVLSGMVLSGMVLNGTAGASGRGGERWSTP